MKMIMDIMRVVRGDYEMMTDHRSVYKITKVIMEITEVTVIMMARAIT